MKQQRPDAETDRQNPDGQRDVRDGFDTDRPESSPLASLQQVAGNQAVQRLADEGALQTASGGEHEQAAERVARSVGKAGTGVAAERRPRDSGSTNPAGTGGDGSQLLPGGQRLPSPVRSPFESWFDRDLGDVRVHTGPEADQAARALGAEAFTYGREVVFKEGTFAPGTDAGRRLLAHELTHVVQQRGGSGPDSDVDVGAVEPAVQRQDAGTSARDTGTTDERDVGVPHSAGHPEMASDSPPPESETPEPRGRSPDISKRGHYTFYLPELASAGKEDGFVVQFTMVDAEAGIASAKVLFRATRDVEETRFPLPEGGPLDPRLLSEGADHALFTLRDSELVPFTVEATADTEDLSIGVTASAPGDVTDSYQIAPPDDNFVPGRGVVMGTLPDGRVYYRQPWTTHMPGGPWYVDEHGDRVDPAAETLAAAQHDAAAEAYWNTFGMLLVLGTTGAAAGGYMAPVISQSQGLSAAAGVTTSLAFQIPEHGLDYTEYDWGTIGFDGVMSAISFRVAKAVSSTFPVSEGYWTNFSKQQGVMMLYGTVIGTLKSQVYGQGTAAGSSAVGQNVQGALNAIKAGALKRFLTTERGKRMFPNGYSGKKMVIVRKMLSVIIQYAVRDYFEMYPKEAGSEGPQGSEPAGSQ